MSPSQGLSPADLWTRLLKQCQDVQASIHPAVRCQFPNSPIPQGTSQLRKLTITCSL
jgi:hypothetical protein